MQASDQTSSTVAETAAPFRQRLLQDYGAEKLEQELTELETCLSEASQLQRPLILGLLFQRYLESDPDFAQLCLVCVAETYQWARLPMSVFLKHIHLEEQRDQAIEKLEQRRVRKLNR